MRFRWTVPGVLCTVKYAVSVKSSRRILRRAAAASKYSVAAHLTATVLVAGVMVQGNLNRTLFHGLLLLPHPAIATVL